MGLVQGLTEFLPVSSSGHLVLANSLLGIKTDTGILFEVMLHVGTLISVMVVFFDDIYKMASELFGAAADIVKGRGLRIKSSPHRTMLVMVIVATIPTGIMGLLFKDVFEKAFGSPVVVSFMLLITGTLLYAANRMKSGFKKASDIKGIDAIIIGIFQGLAITPGISRSGSTIFAGLMRGFSRDLATRFSFIMSIPAILGAAVLEFSDYYSAPVSASEIAVMFAGAAVAAVSGTLAIKFLVGILKRGKLHYFSYYCWLVGFISLATYLVLL
jgi:undecaprenyl-diphosphatase